MDKKIRQRYLSNPEICPYCEGQVEADTETEFAYNQAWRKVFCEKCDKEWREIFTLTDIEGV